MSSYSSFPYAGERDAALAYLRKEAESTDGWNLFDTKNGVSYEKKVVPGDKSAVPLVRGRGIIERFTPEQFLSLNSYVGTRHTWDNRIEKADIIKRYVHGHVVNNFSHGGLSFVISGRDIVGIQDTVFHPDGKIERFQTSVDDPSVKAMSGKVRATLELAGWALKPVAQGTEVTYVVKLNPNVSMPASVINNTAVPEIPAVIAKCAELLKRQGSPPYMSRTAQSEIIAADFDYDSKKCEMVLLGKGGDTFDIFFDERMYPKGPKVEAGAGVGVVRAEGKLNVVIEGDADGREVAITLSSIE